MKKYLILLLLGGCSLNPKIETVNKVFDDDCANFSQYVRSVVLMRDIGVLQENVELIVKSEQSFAKGPVIRDSYSRPDLTPVTAAKMSYDSCVDRTFEGMSNALSTAETEYQNLQKARVLNVIQRNREPLTLKLDRSF